MKHFLILLLIFVGLHAEGEKQKLTIGAGPYIQTQPYTNVDSLVLASPVIFYDNGIVYIRWSRAGVYFLGDSQDDYSWGFSLTTQPRTYGYKPTDSETLTGMQEKKSTWEAGLAFSAKTEKAYIEIMLLTDILNEYDSWMLKTEIGYDFKFGDLSLYPSIIIGYQSSEFLDYYYGISPEESLASGHNEHSPDAGLQIGMQTYIKYPLTDSLSTLINIKVDKLPSEATSSPIVNDDYIYSGLVSLIYTIEY